ncbi:unnamed protein product [Malus baccata var. baccata]
MAIIPNEALPHCPIRSLMYLSQRYRLVCRQNGTERNETGQDGTERRGSKDALGWEQGGRRRRRRGYNFVFHGCGTSRSRGVRRNENSPKIRLMQ